MQDLRPAQSLAARDWLTALNRLEASGSPYALVTVLRVEAPASARAGDKAVVTPAGEFHGWIGGGCAQPVVVKAVKEALDKNTPLTIRITPTASDDDTAVVREVAMACHSGGSVELFIEPHQPSEPLAVYGSSPVAQVLQDLAIRVGIPVITSPGARWAVVATQGQGDESALRQALQAGVQCVWFVASARKWSRLQQDLVAAGLSPEALRRVQAPAGLEIGAKTPEEIALSVLAAVVQARRSDLHVPRSQERLTQTSLSEAVASPVISIDTPPTKSCCGGGA